MSNSKNTKPPENLNFLINFSLSYSLKNVSVQQTLGFFENSIPFLLSGAHCCHIFRLLLESL